MPCKKMPITKAKTAAGTGRPNAPKTACSPKTDKTATTADNKRPAPYWGMDEKKCRIAGSRLITQSFFLRAGLKKVQARHVLAHRTVLRTG